MNDARREPFNDLPDDESDIQLEPSDLWHCGIRARGRGPEQWGAVAPASA